MDCEQAEDLENIIAYAGILSKIMVYISADFQT